MARCIRCDRCGKIMEEIPIGEENARKNIEFKVTTAYMPASGKELKDVVVRRNFDKDLCSDCCWGLENVIFKYMEEKK